MGSTNEKSKFGVKVIKGRVMMVFVGIAVAAIIIDRIYHLINQ